MEGIEIHETLDHRIAQRGVLDLIQTVEQHQGCPTL
jgi:hypothetical protein